MYICPLKAVKIEQIHIDKMKEEGKIYYEAPATTVVEVKMESSLLDASLLDASLDATRGGYGEVIEDSWGGA